MKLSIVIPVYNEAETIEAVYRRVATVALDNIEKEIVIVDDGSADGTVEVLKKLESEGVRILYHERNRGKGAAFRTGLNEVRGDIILVQDADLEYDPTEYSKLIRPIMDDKADVVYGSRFVGAEPHRVLCSWHYVGNRFLTLLSNMLTNLNLTDMETGYKVFRADVLKRIEIQENRFGFEPEITAKVARMKVRIYEVGISYFNRTYEEGKKIRWKDGIRALWCIIKYRFLRI